MSQGRDEGDARVDDLLRPLDGEAGPARRISRQKSAALVFAALEAATHEAPSRPKVRKKGPPMWLVAGAVLFTGAAAAAVWTWGRAQESQAMRSGEAGAAPDAASDSARPVPPAPADSVKGAGAQVPPEPVPGEPRGSVEGAGASANTSQGSVDGGPRGSVEGLGAHVAPESARAGPPVSAEPSAAPRAAAVRKQSSRASSITAPEDLLREANALRAAGRWKDAEALYLRVIREQPSSLAAYVARVASGSLRLEHLGNARGALRQYQEALRLQPQGVLDQEVRHGIAEAWRALGNTESEARALNDFLTHHPDSPLVPNARARLRELGSP